MAAGCQLSLFPSTVVGDLLSLVPSTAVGCQLLLVPSMPEERTARPLRPPPRERWPRRPVADSSTSKAPAQRARQ
eukprot:11854577-Alexandrium_andersonii.AAC.1